MMATTIDGDGHTDDRRPLKRARRVGPFGSSPSGSSDDPAAAPLGSGAAAVVVAVPPETRGALRQMFLCVVCRDLVTEPATCKCGHTFCRGCLERWMDRKSTCPSCRKRVRPNDIYDNAPVRAIIEEWLRCRCSACGLTAEPEEVDAHIAAGCPKEELACEACRRTMQRRRLAKHLRVCPVFVRPCANAPRGCTFAGDRACRIRHRRDECRFHPCAARASGCPFLGTRDELRDHDGPKAPGVCLFRLRARVCAIERALGITNGGDVAAEAAAELEEREPAAERAASVVDSSDSSSSSSTSSSFSSSTSSGAEEERA